MSKREAKLQEWLDRFISSSLAARYERCNADMTVVDWSPEELKTYLGTYFPRSYAEAYCIFSDYFMSSSDAYATKESLTIFDLGCGTGGELMGLLRAIEECLPSVRRAVVRALDGNKCSVDFCRQIVEQYKANSNRLSVDYQVGHYVIDHPSDLEVIGHAMRLNYDLIISFKMMCEVVTQKRLGDRNPYVEFVKIFSPRLSADGMVCMADVTSFNKVASRWLPDMLDEGVTASRGCVVFRNAGYHEEFRVSHTLNQCDCSKLAWRFVRFDQ